MWNAWIKYGRRAQVYVLVTVPPTNRVSLAYWYLNHFPSFEWPEDSVLYIWGDKTSRSISQRRMLSKACLCEGRGWFPSMNRLRPWRTTLTLPDLSPQRPPCPFLSSYQRQRLFGVAPRDRTGHPLLARRKRWATRTTPPHGCDICFEDNLVIVHQGFMLSFLILADLLSLVKINTEAEGIMLFKIFQFSHLDRSGYKTALMKKSTWFFIFVYLILRGEQVVVHLFIYFMTNYIIW